jgi:hypothetical protein
MIDDSGNPPAPPRIVIAGYRQLIARAHAHGISIIGATLTPFEDALHNTPFYQYYDEDKEKKREAINAWIRADGRVVRPALIERRGRFSRRRARR